MGNNIHFLPDNVHVTGEDKTTLLTAAASTDVYIHSCCCGNGGCGRAKCSWKKKIPSPRESRSTDTDDQHGIVEEPLFYESLYGSACPFPHEYEPLSFAKIEGTLQQQPATCLH
jgi:uncharacterized 2Fe-2S/4Fe-4S cluster protein (DUF4445 family)